MQINFERKPPFCNNISYATKIKTLSSYSEDYQGIKIPKKEIIYKFSSIAILNSVNTKVLPTSIYGRIWIWENRRSFLFW